MIHRLSNLRDAAKAVSREVHTMTHHQKDLSELLKVLALCGNQWMCFEERYDLGSKILQPKNRVHKEVFLVIVTSSIAVDLAASEVLKEYLQGFNAPFALDYCKTGLNLPAQRHLSISLDRTAEAPFPVDEADDPLLDSWPFLLIVRTGRVVTAHVTTLLRGCDKN